MPRCCNACCVGGGAYQQGGFHRLQQQELANAAVASRASHESGSIKEDFSCVMNVALIFANHHSFLWVCKPCASIILIRRRPRRVTRFVVYLRVSTLRQGASGLGIEAQREAVTRHVASTGGRILAEVVETESGKQSTRPQLARALANAFMTTSVMIIADTTELSLYNLVQIPEVYRQASQHDFRDRPMSQQAGFRKKVAGDTLRTLLPNACGRHFRSTIATRG